MCMRVYKYIYVYVHTCIEIDADIHRLHTSTQGLFKAIHVDYVRGIQGP